MFDSLVTIIIASACIKSSLVFGGLLWGMEFRGIAAAVPTAAITLVCSWIVLHGISPHPVDLSTAGAAPYLTAIQEALPRYTEFLHSKSGEAIQIVATGQLVVALKLIALLLIPLALVDIIIGTSASIMQVADGSIALSRSLIKIALVLSVGWWSDLLQECTKI
jgi:hypothetical protein